MHKQRQLELLDFDEPLKMPPHDVETLAASSIAEHPVAAKPHLSELATLKAPSDFGPAKTGAEFLKLAGDALSDLARDLEAGKSDTLLKYLATMGTFHSYSFSNIMLILIQRPDATHVAGFNAWKQLGRYVKKGEKGIGIIAPMIYGKKKDDCQPFEENSDDEQPRIRFKVVHVFDASQTDGEPLPEFSEVCGDPGSHLFRLRDIVTQRGIALSYEDIAGSTEGMSRGGSIVIQSGLPPAKEFSVLVHEYAHELLHRKDRRKETTKSQRETEAEAVAFVVSQAIGLDCGSQTSDYIQLCKGDAKTLSSSLDLIQKTAAGVLSELMPKKDNNNKEDHD